ncbi:MAG: response regulator [Acetobacteraceae bacterium]|nr:response regulator [Acetobacteraceae bacterium]
MRLLVVEDNAQLASLIAKLLKENGFAVDAVATADAALAAMDTAHYDLLLLDLSLPGGDGADILKAIRRRGRSTPVLVATARADVTQRVQTLNEGADDYLVKPFSLEELLARVRALLRRSPQLAETVLTAGNVALDTASLTLQVADTPIEVPRRELVVLATLLRQCGRLVSRQNLINAVYSFDDEVTPNAIEAAVSRLRRRLEAHGATVSITAMRGLGYILVPADVHTPTL